MNGQRIKVIGFQCEFIWHSPENEDEVFRVLTGRFRMESRDRHAWIEEGEFLIISRRVEHRPFADEEARLAL